MPIQSVPLVSGGVRVAVFFPDSDLADRATIALRRSIQGRIADGFVAPTREMVHVRGYRSIRLAMEGRRGPSDGASAASVALIVRFRRVEIPPFPVP